MKRGIYEWRMNSRGLWAWFDGLSQLSGAYADHAEADYAFDNEPRLWSRSISSGVYVSFSEHSEFTRLDAMYGRFTEAQLLCEIDRLADEIASLQRAARREFDGNGGRRTGAAVAAEASREFGREKLLAEMYRKHKFNAV